MSGAELGPFGEDPPPVLEQLFWMFDDDGGAEVAAEPYGRRHRSPVDR